MSLGSQYSFIPPTENVAFQTLNQTLPIRLVAGDFNMDGYPDVLTVMRRRSSASGPYVKPKNLTKITVVINVSCLTTSKRTFSEILSFFSTKLSFFRFTQEAVLLINSRNDHRCSECADRVFVKESNLNGLADVTLAAFFDFYEDVRPSF